LAGLAVAVVAVLRVAALRVPLLPLPPLLLLVDLEVAVAVAVHKGKDLSIPVLFISLAAIAEDPHDPIEVARVAKIKRNGSKH